MSKEKKLSKNEFELIDIYERLMRDCVSPAQKRHKLRELLMRHKSLIESSAQEPSDEIYEYALGILNKLDFEGLSLQEKVNLLVRSLLPGQEPSEAKIEEVATKWAHKISYSTIKELLKEYDKLRRG